MGLQAGESTPVVFLLSPARCDGQRAKVVMNPGASFDLATRLRSTNGAPLGDVFSFLSGLYFRGKLEYARAFTAPERLESAIRIITTDRGLVAPAVHVTLDDLRAFSRVDIAGGDPRYLVPLTRDIEQLRRITSADASVVLLGSIATGKYVDLLWPLFGDRLRFPRRFAGIGDMSRGAMMLRAARSGEELEYVTLNVDRHRPKGTRERDLSGLNLNTE